MVGRFMTAYIAEIQFAFPSFFATFREPSMTSPRFLDNGDGEITLMEFVEGVPCLSTDPK